MASPTEPLDDKQTHLVVHYLEAADKVNAAVLALLLGALLSIQLAHVAVSDAQTGQVDRLYRTSDHLQQLGVFVGYEKDRSLEDRLVFV